MDGIRFAPRSDAPETAAPAKNAVRAGVVSTSVGTIRTVRGIRGGETRHGARRASSWNERLAHPWRKSDGVLPLIRRTSPEIRRDRCFETPACVPTWPQSV